MPVPAPRKGEKQSKYVSRCMKFWGGEDTDLKPKQQLAICYDKYRKSKSKKKPSKPKAKAKAKVTKNLVDELKKLKNYYNDNYCSK